MKGGQTMKLFSRKGLIVLPLVLGITTGSATFAGTSQGTVSFLQVLADDFFLFTAGPISSKPACNTAQSDQWEMTLRSPSGRAMLSQLLIAQIQSRQVQVVGTGACNGPSSNFREGPQRLLIVP